MANDVCVLVLKLKGSNEFTLIFFKCKYHTVANHAELSCWHQKTVPKLSPVHFLIWKLWRTSSSALRGLWLGKDCTKSLIAAQYFKNFHWAKVLQSIDFMQKPKPTFIAPKVLVLNILANWYLFAKTYFPLEWSVCTFSSTAIFLKTLTRGKFLCPQNCPTLSNDTKNRKTDQNHRWISLIFSAVSVDAHTVKTNSWVFHCWFSAIVYPDICRSGKQLLRNNLGFQSCCPAKKKV